MAILKEKIDIGRRTIDLEYDKDKYSIDCFIDDEEQNNDFIDNRKIYIILKRKSDNRIIKVFSEPISFLVQVDNNDDTHFIVSTYNQFETCHLIDYVDKDYNDKLIVKNKYINEDPILENNRVGSSFVVRQFNSGGYIYNVGNDYCSEFYDKIYKEDKINEIIGKDVLLVEQIKYCCSNSKIFDTITFGINPDTLRIVTPIWISLQKRLINIYTEEEFEEFKKNYPPHAFDVTDRETFTIYNEVYNYLDKINDQLENNDEVYKDGFDVNTEFIKKFVPSSK